MERSSADIEPATRCEYLPDRDWSFEYRSAETLTGDEYQLLLDQGWRRFGYVLFRPRCPSCSLCKSLRVPVRTFVPTRSQKRVSAKNAKTALKIDQPTLDSDTYELYLRFHRNREEKRSWSKREQEDPLIYFTSFVLNPIRTQEWRYFADGTLAGVGFVDVLPQGLSAIYFFHSPEQHRLSLGTWNILSLITRAGELGLPYVYLGFYVPGCVSMEYKAKFGPNERLSASGEWTESMVE